MKMAVNKTYKFSTIATGILNASYDNMKLVGILSADVAAQSTDIVTLHNKIVSQSNNTHIPLKYQDCTYLQFKNAGMETILAYEYIVEDTISLIENKTLLITVNNYNSGDANIILEALKGLGFYDVKTEIK